MPELPEVQTVVDSLRPALVGRRIVTVQLHRSDVVDPPGIDLAARLMNRSVRAIDRRAKRIVFTLDNAERFYIHLGMSGRLTLAATDKSIAKHTHLQLRFDNGPEMRFIDPRRFGGIWWLGSAVDDDRLGPEPLGLRAAELAARLAGTKRAIKSALLDQSLIAGLGNIYVDESLFGAAIHPLLRADKLTKTQVAALVRSIKATLRRALNHRGSTLRDYRDANGDAGNFQRLHLVYAREGQPCRKCRSLIVRIVVGGRSTHFCPVCQSSAKTQATSGVQGLAEANLVVLLRPEP
jgi:formamidopyrimidine-DNA glycosylase